MVNPDPTTPLVACQDGCGRLYAPCARSVHVQVFHAPDGEHPIVDTRAPGFAGEDDGSKYGTLGEPPERMGGPQ